MHSTSNITCDQASTTPFAIHPTLSNAFFFCGLGVAFKTKSRLYHITTYCTVCHDIQRSYVDLCVIAIVMGATALQQR